MIINFTRKQCVGTGIDLWITYDMSEAEVSYIIHQESRKFTEFYWFTKNLGIFTGIKYFTKPIVELNTTVYCVGRERNDGLNDCQALQPSRQPCIVSWIFNKCHQSRPRMHGVTNARTMKTFIVYKQRSCWTNYNEHRGRVQNRLFN